MKLKCDDHNRRVMVLSNSDVIHREDGSKCDTNTVSMGDQTQLRTYMSAQEREAFGRARVEMSPEQLRASRDLSPATRLLNEIYGSPLELDC